MTIKKLFASLKSVLDATVKIVLLNLCTPYSPPHVICRDTLS